MVTPSDKDIIVKIKQGEIDQFALIVRKHAQKIENYVGSKLFKKEDVDDLVQEIFISFYKSIPRFNPEKPVLPYLYTITKNQLKMYYRSLKKTVPLKEEIAADTIKDDIPDESVLKILDEKDRIYITEIADGYSYEEVSKRYKISLNTLKSKVRRARLKMKKINEEI